jgi:lipopolysaccharide export system protein LptA
VRNFKDIYRSQGHRFSYTASIRAAVLAGLFILTTGVALAQVTPEEEDPTTVHEVELSADLLEGAIENGETIRRLTGNVHLRQEVTLLWSDQAIEYPARQDILFMGNVRIVDEGDTLWADRVLYNRQTKIGRAEGDVRLSDGDVRVNAPSGIYYVDEERAEFEGGVRMVDSTAVLTSLRGQYWLEEKRAEFYEDVLLVEDRSNMEADSVTYYRETEVAQAYGNVFITHLGGEEEEAEADTTSQVFLFGDTAYHDNRIGFSRIEGQPLLVRIEQDTTGTSVDTLIVRARWLESTQNDSLDRLVAVDSVRIWQNDIAAIADSVVSTRVSVPAADSTLEADSSATQEEILLFGSPVVWQEQSQITGDTIIVKARSGSIDSLLAPSNAFIAQLDTALNKVQQLKGRSMLGLFEQDTLRTLEVGPNAEVIYYLQGEDGELAGAVQVSGDAVVFRFEQGEIRSIRFEGQNEGQQYDVGIIPAPFELEGFRWIPEQRPVKDVLLERAGDRLSRLPPVQPALTSTEP